MQNKKPKVNSDLLNKNNAKLKGEFISIIHAFEVGNDLYFGYNNNFDNKYGSVKLQDVELLDGFSLNHPKLQDLMAKYELN